MRQTSTLGFGELIDAVIDEATHWGTPPDLKQRDGTWFEAATRSFEIPYLEIWDQTKNEMVRLFENAKQGIRAGALADDHNVLTALGCFGREKGSGTISTAAAVYLASRHAAQPKQGVLRAAFEKGADTDTVAAMVGGLAGSLAGEEWLPNSWLNVQDADYIRRLARRLAACPETDQQENVHGFNDSERVLNRIAEVHDGREIDLADRRVVVNRMPDPKPITKSISVRVWRLTTTEGQTFQAFKTQRLKSSKQNVNLRDANEISIVEPTIADEPKTTIAGSQELFSLFRSKLENCLATGDALKTKEIEETFDIVQSQANRWLSRAIQEGWLIQVSSRPKRFDLKHKIENPAKVKSAPST